MDCSLKAGSFLKWAGFWLPPVDITYIDCRYESKQRQPYVILDGGINHLNYYGQAMAMKHPYCSQLDFEGHEKTVGEEQHWNLCGALCTVSDVIVKQFPLRNPKICDILVFERVGAYSVTEGIYLFLSRPLPKIYFWTQADGLLSAGWHTY